MGTHYLRYSVYFSVFSGRSSIRLCFLFYSYMTRVEIWKNKIMHAWFTSVKINTFYNFWWSCLVLISIECLLLYYNVNKISIIFSIFVLEFKYHSCHKNCVSMYNWNVVTWHWFLYTYTSVWIVLNTHFNLTPYFQN
jgi:hypothetical protein